MDTDQKYIYMYISRTNTLFLYVLKQFTFNLSKPFNHVNSSDIIDSFCTFILQVDICNLNATLCTSSDNTVTVTSSAAFIYPFCISCILGDLLGVTIVISYHLHFLFKTKVNTFHILPGTRKHFRVLIHPFHLVHSVVISL